jgi:hypothetical protein
MKFEDLYEDDDEPWWRGCDEPQKGEVKVMFDNGRFWKALDSGHARRNPFLPKKGYHASEIFKKFPGQFVGFKRYNIVKPDGARTNVEVKVQLRHVFPIMK